MGWGVDSRKTAGWGRAIGWNRVIGWDIELDKSMTSEWGKGSEWDRDLSQGIALGLGKEVELDWELVRDTLLDWDRERGCGKVVG